VEFREVVRKRRMVRRFAPTPLPAEVTERVLAHAQRGPSAGFTQGFALLALEGPKQTGRLWAALSQGDRGAPPASLDGVRAAPLIVLPLASKQAYLDRYAEPDKGWADRDEGRWPVPYWYVDAGFAALLMLLTATDEQLGALLFGIPVALTPAVRDAFGIPADHTPVGAVAVGYRLPEPARTGRAATRPRRAATDVIHRGHW
jgi:nitroreductase